MKSNRDRNNVAGNFKITSYQLQPKIFTEFNFSQFTPFVGVGYTSMLFKSSTDDRKIYAYNRDGFSLNNTQSGIDLNIGLKYNFEKRLFVQIQYDYIVLGVMEPIINSRYNTNVNILKIGIGTDF